MKNTKNLSLSVLTILSFVAVLALSPIAARAADAVPAPVDHSKMDHAAMDHSKMDHAAMKHDAAPVAASLAVPAGCGSAVVIKVSGLVCDFCARSIEKTLKQGAGVTDVKVDLDAGTVKVSLAKGTAADEAKLKQQITDAGYTVTGFEKGSCQ